NDAGGELFIGIKNNPREISGLEHDQLDTIENQISNIVNDQCAPTVLPEITFIKENGKHVIRVSFIKTNYASQLELQLELQQELQHELRHELEHESMYTQILLIVKEKTSSKKEISTALGQKSISSQLNKINNKLLDDYLIERTIPNKPSSSKQQYKITQRGIVFLQLLKNKKA
ncbi:ATP-binding protein, partial [uncultured Polaribacter sp.]|uniref:AlbA family DNA-binding domain-containing protein n=1 Tax=uncultured Polaribacter sp. TaxID=174711 RepID=UPI0030D71991